jgi:hypothetical protein
MEVISGISAKERFNNIFLRNHLKKIFKMQSGVIYSFVLMNYFLRHNYVRHCQFSNVHLSFMEFTLYPSSCD